MLMILLANMLILAHAVVPHHHHNKVFVAIVNILDHDAQDIFNHEHGHEHHHDGDAKHHDGPAHHHDGDSEDCLMSEAEAAAALKVQTDDGSECFVVPLLDNEVSQLIWLAAFGLYELTFTPYYTEDNVRRRTYVTSGHTDFVARSKGLRDENKKYHLCRSSASDRNYGWLQTDGNRNRT